jgi:hypothetical protein
LNGKQHYIQAKRSRDMELNRKNFELYQSRDAKKVEWCSERNIPLLVISYLDFHRIPELIEAFIKKYIYRRGRSYGLPFFVYIWYGIIILARDCRKREAAQ